MTICFKSSPPELQLECRSVLYLLSAKQDRFNDRSLVTVRDEGQGWDWYGDDQVGLFALGDRTEGVAYSHCVG